MASRIRGLTRFRIIALLTLAVLIGATAMNVASGSGGKKTGLQDQPNQEDPSAAEAAQAGKNGGDVAPAVDPILIE